MSDVKNDKRSSLKDQAKYVKFCLRFLCLLNTCTLGVTRKICLIILSALFQKLRKKQCFGVRSASHMLFPKVLKAS